MTNEPLSPAEGGRAGGKGVLRIMAVLAFVHLVFVVTSVTTSFERASPGVVRNSALSYCNLSGTFRDYSFFAPTVSSAIKAAFLIEGKAGPPTLVTFGSESREIAFRYSSLIRSGMGDERARDLFAQSWAAVLLGNRPNAESVTVMVEWMLLPSMDEYRRGQQPEWKPLYVGKFSRRQGLSERPSP